MTVAVAKHPVQPHLEGRGLGASWRVEGAFGRVHSA